MTLDFSVAILKAIEDGEMPQLEEHLLASYKSCSPSTGIGDSSSLGHRPFSGLFLISGGFSAFAFLVATMRLARRHHHFIRAKLDGIRRLAYAILNQCYQKVKFRFFQGNLVLPTNSQDSISMT